MVSNLEEASTEMLSSFVRIIKVISLPLASGHTGVINLKPKTQNSNFKTPNTHTLYPEPQPLNPEP